MIFEVGEEYWISYGTTEEQSNGRIKVLEVDGTWLKVESDQLEPLINVAAPIYISARKRSRETEDKVTNEFGFASTGLRDSLSDKLPY